MQRNPTDVAADPLQCTHFGRFLLIFAISRPLRCHNETREEPRLLVKVPFNFQEEVPRGTLQRWKRAPNTKVWLCREVSLFWALKLYDFWDDVTITHSSLQTTFKVWEEPLLTLGTPVFTDRENTGSTLRQEPPKTVTFHENFGRSCNIDDSE